LAEGLASVVGWAVTAGLGVLGTALAEETAVPGGKAARAGRAEERQCGLRCRRKSPRQRKCCDW
jgi:hypothetical protein